MTRPHDIDPPIELDEADDELVCSACNTRMDFAPDPVTTFGILYEAPKAA